MINKKIIKTFVILLMIFMIQPIFSKKKYNYSPVQIGNYDLALALSKKIMDEKNLVIDNFDYGRGFITGKYIYFRDIIIRMRAKVLFRYENNLLNIEITEMENKRSYGWESTETVITNAPRKIAAKISKRLREINKDQGMKNLAFKEFFSDIDVNYKFLFNASNLAIKRWVRQHMKGKKFIWDVEFNNIDENKDKNPEIKKYKYIETYNYASGKSISSNLINSLKKKFLILKYTNSDKNILTKGGSFINVEGICVSAHRSMGGDIVIIFKDIPK